MSIEKTYQKKTPLEHILLRPDTYIGSVDTLTDKYWVYDDTKEKLVFKEVSIVPGLFKIFDEILVNAVDNIYRDKKQKVIKVSINSNKNEISVFNDGKGVPVVTHKEHKVYVPELIFGHLLTSSNYNDEEKKTIGGRNGYGAKLANIFSTKFIIETVDMQNKKHYIQEFSDNMKVIGQPKITDINSNSEHKSDFTKITFYPDLKKFKMKALDNDIISLMKKRVYDISGTTPFSLNVYYNNKLISEVRQFEQYIDLYLKDEYFDKSQNIEYPKIYDSSNDRWEVMVTMSDYFQQVSFVNNICTSKGGTHVNYITDQISERILTHIKKKNKDINIKPQQVKNHLFVFINCKIENPTFDSQTKENMTLKPSNFGSECELSEKFYKQLLGSIVVTNIVSNVKAKETIKLNKALSSTSKKVSRLLGIAKLDDANNAGTKLSKNCTLILTEGDSAKALAMSGLEVVGRDNFGVFPLKGKLLNVRDCNNAKLLNNEEIQNIIKIIGLQVGKDYSSGTSCLRYGKLMIMADQDPDGSHIKGLLINFIDNFWPSLIKSNNFLVQFITPIVKVTFPDQTVRNFYTVNDFKNFYENSPENIQNKLKIKYYKGLGTSTSKEAKEYFKNFNKNSIEFTYSNEEDTECIDLAFNNKKAEGRKKWLSEIDLNSTLDYTKKFVRYKDFFNKEFIFFSYSDNARSIPSVVDGLKPSERKILYSCFKRKLVNELKVAQLAGYVAEHSAYHHGEQSLCMTITAMAQDFVGTNNVNLLMPIGQFGNRYSGSKSAASPRYIFTLLNKLTRMLFIESDDAVMTYNVEEGNKIEPVYYIPILPLLLVNGAEGIGTGWATNIPSYHPLEIADNLIKKLEFDRNFNEMTPWYKGFTGNIVAKQIGVNEKKGKDKDKETSEIGQANDSQTKSYSAYGVFELIPQDFEIKITEIPFKSTVSQYKEFLESCFVENKENTKKEIEITDMSESHSDNSVFFSITLTSESYKKFESMDYHQQVKVLKLSSPITTSNMVAFDVNNQIKKYNDTSEILEDFYLKRLETYSARKACTLNKLQYQRDIISNKLSFIKMLLKGEMSFLNKKKDEIIKVLESKGFKSESDIKKMYALGFKTYLANKHEVVIDENGQNVVESTSSSKDFDYLMNMSIWTLTNEKVESLTEHYNNLVKEIDILSNTDVKDLWKKDIENFVNEYSKTISASERNINFAKRSTVQNVNSVDNTKIVINKSSTVKDNLKEKKEKNELKSKNNNNSNNVSNNNINKSSKIIDDNDDFNSINLNESNSNFKTDTKGFINTSTINKDNTNIINDKSNITNISETKKTYTNEEYYKLPLLERIKLSKGINNLEGTKINEKDINLMNKTLDSFLGAKRGEISTTVVTENNSIKKTPQKVKDKPNCGNEKINITKSKTPKKSKAKDDMKDDSNGSDDSVEIIDVKSVPKVPINSGRVSSRAAAQNRKIIIESDEE